jgi:hypothetical protein
MLSCVVLTMSSCALTGHEERRGEQPQSGGTPSVMTPPAIPEQPLIRSIHEWGGSVAVITEPRDSRGGFRLATVEPGGSRIIPFGEVRCDSYHDVGHSPEAGKILVCGRQDATQVFRRVDESWTPLTPPLQGAAFRVAVDGNDIVLMSENAIYRIGGPPAIPPIPMPRGLPGLLEAPTAMLLADGMLYAAFDRGEFGGGLYRFALSQSPLTPTRIVDENVGFLARAQSGAIWAAGGLSHLIGRRGVLYRVEGAGAEIIARISGFETGDDATVIDEKSGVEFPRLTSLDGLAFSVDDRPIVVFPELGLFKLVPGGFAPLYQGTLVFSYPSRLGDMPIGVGSSPVGMVTTSGGDIYVATRSLGIFRFRNATQLALEQLTFAER